MQRSVSKLLPLAAAFAVGVVFASFVVSPFQRMYTIQRVDRHSIFSSKNKLLDGGESREATDQPLFRNDPPAPSLPHVRETLPKANFSNNRKEDSSLRFIRDSGLVSSLPDLATIRDLPLAKLSVIAHSYLDNDDIQCRRKLRMGNVKDGGWEVCDDYEWRPVPPCLVYSFGINYDFSFDDDIAKVYGCDVYSFDPSMVKQPSYQRSERVVFYRYGLGDHSGSPPVTNDKGWILHSLSNFRSMLNHTDKIIDVIKMDIERAEWDSLRTMLHEQQLRNVRQLLVEFHMGNPDGPGVLRPALEVLSGLEKIGFRRFYVHKNGDCGRKGLLFPVMRTECYEVQYVNSRLRRESP